MRLPEQRKRLVWIGALGSALVGVGLLFWLRGAPAEAADPEPGMAELAKHERNQDAAALERKIDDSNPRVASQAARVYGKVAGRSGRPTLQRAMRDARPMVRQGAVAGYARTVPPWEVDAIAPVLAVVKEPEQPPEVVVAGLRALAELRAWDSLDQVMEKMNHEDRAVREAAAKTFEEITFTNLNFTYKPDDLPNKRLASIRVLRDFTREPGRRQWYMDWLQTLKKPEENPQ